MARRRNNFVSKKTAQSVLKALLAPADLRRLQFLRVVFLSGLPGSGKTTVARLLTTCYGFERFSSDQIRTGDLFPGQHHRKGVEHERVMTARFLVYEELARRAVKALNQGKKVVIDGTNLDDKRLTVLGGILAHVPVEQVAFVILRPPEWIMRRRFLEKGKAEAKEWWSVYKYWRKYMREGKAAFPTETVFPRVRQMHVRRYAIRTFDWVTEIKGIIWDVDGTLYKDIPKLKRAIDQAAIKKLAEILKLSKRKGEKEFWKRYKKLGSKTRVLNSAGVKGKDFFRDLSARVGYEKFLKKDRKLIRAIKSLGHLRHFVLTNATLGQTMKKLSTLGVSNGLFDQILATYEFSYMKPDPKVFKWAARKTGLKREQLLAVGDREETDILPARKVDLRTCYVWGVSREADVSVPTVYEVAELFGKEI